MNIISITIKYKFKSQNIYIRYWSRYIAVFP